MSAKAVGKVLIYLRIKAKHKKCNLSSLIILENG